VTIKKYYACEIDKYAMEIAQKNYPDTIQLGNILDIDPSKLPRIDLLIGGSPCQGFSVAGKQLNFEDERSKLFFSFVDLLVLLKPRRFLLENVKMKKEYQDKISGLLGVEPIEINSALVSAQNRKRLYWTDLPLVSQPEDKGIMLKDIVQDGHVDRDKSYAITASYRFGTSAQDYLLKCRRQQVFSCVDRDKSYCLDANYHKGGNLKSYFEKKRRQQVFDRCVEVAKADIKAYDCNRRIYDLKGKSPTLTTCGGGHREPKVMIPTDINHKNVVT
ncbi:unnamed protein product, partial [marine sediment metagenome]